MQNNKLSTALKHGLFLIAELPIGIFYFTIAVTGLSLAAGLLPLFLVGIPLFIALMGFANFLMKFEYTRYHALLGEMPAAMVERGIHDTPIRMLDRAKLAIHSADNWKSILMMLIKLPLGIASFSVTVTLLAFSLGLLAYPIVYYVILESIGIDIYQGSPLSYITDLGATEASLLYFCLGIFASLGVIRILPAISRIYISTYIKLLKM